jgi:FixJ family two-component response regulator
MRSQAEGLRRYMSDAKRTIVVVDDDAEMGQAIERLLSAAGYRTATFQSAEAMLEDEAAVKADCFILDIHLPGISGFELQQRIAMRSTVAPVIFITAYDDLASREQAQATGAVALFAKPFRGQPLLAAIADALVHT